MRTPPPVLALVVAAAAQRALTRDSASPSAVRRAAAAVTAAASAATMGTAARQFRSRGTTVDPLRPERATSLVVSGPFTFTRNPMYVGMAGVLVSHAFLRGSVKALPPAAAFVLLIDRVQIPPEEVAMTSLFGADYELYRSRVPRWLL